MDPPLSPTTAALLSVLLDAWEHKRDIDGWQLMKTLHRSGPTVYRVLDQLESRRWITGEFEPPDPKRKNKPRRRFYRLTGIGLEAARAHAPREPRPVPTLRARLGLEMLFGGRT